MRLLLIEDDEKVIRMLVRGLIEERFTVEVASDGDAGLDKLTSDAFDVCILDLMLPQLPGLEVLERAREAGVKTPIIILTALDAVPDRVRGLNLGADDYLAKPFAFAELLARVRALLRRGSELKSAKLRFGDLELDPTGHRVTRGDSEIELSKMQFGVLECLMLHRGEVVSRGRLLERVFGYAFEPSTNIVDVHIAHLRKKIDRKGQPSLITTIRGIGYRLGEPGDA